MKRARFHEKATLPVLGFEPINKPTLTASYEVAYPISKHDKPHKKKGWVKADMKLVGFSTLNRVKNQVFHRVQYSVHFFFLFVCFHLFMQPLVTWS